MNWWKWLCVALLFYTVIGGLLFDVPRLGILNESIRNIHFHVPMWFGMIFLFGFSMWHSIAFLRKGNPDADLLAVEAVNVGLLFGAAGLLTGMIWARYTWGAWWSGDPKQNASAIGMLIYLAYIVLRGSFDSEEQKARISAVFNIFAFFLLIPLLFILPRLTDSLHPGNGGNPGFNSYDLDNRLRTVFYPAVIGWSMLGYWFTMSAYRFTKLKISWERLKAEQGE
jgi:heme exporter protein C